MPSKQSKRPKRPEKVEINYANLNPKLVPLVSQIRQMPESYTPNDVLRELLPLLQRKNRGRVPKAPIVVDGETILKCSFYNRYFFITDKLGKPVFSRSAATTTGYFDYSKEGQKQYVRIKAEAKQFKAALIEEKIKHKLPYTDVSEDERNYIEKLKSQCEPPEHYREYVPIADNTSDTNSAGDTDSANNGQCEADKKAETAK